MTMKQGTVKFPAGKEFPNKFKPGEMQQNLVLTMEDGTEEKIYFQSGRVPHSTLQKGDSANILYEQMNGRTIRKLYANAGANPSPNNSQYNQSASATPSSPAASNNASNNKMSAREQVDLMLNAYTVIFDEINRKFADAGYPDLSTEDVRTIATSIMINLDRSNCDLKDLLSKPANTSEPDNTDTIDPDFDGKPLF